MKTETKMQQFKLTRSGKRPLVFTGKILSEHNFIDDSSDGPISYQTVRVYQTQAGSFVVELYDFPAGGDAGIRLNPLGEVFDSAEKAVSFIENKMPTNAGDVAEDLEVSEQIA